MRLFKKKPVYYHYFFAFRGTASESEYVRREHIAFRSGRIEVEQGDGRASLFVRALEEAQVNLAETSVVIYYTLEKDKL